MSRMVQIRNVPEDLHRALKARAALEGVSLSDLLLNEMRQIVERPSLSELRRRLATRARVTPSVPPTAAVREERERR